MLPHLAPRFGCPRKAEHVPEGHLHPEPGQVAGGLGVGRETPGDGTGCLVGWFHDGAIVAEGRPVGQRSRQADPVLTTALHSRHDGPPPRSATIRAERSRAILSTRQAVRLGRLGGKVSAVDRKGDREWGRRAQRQCAAATMHLAYPGLTRLWAINAARTRWGLPVLPVPDVPLSDRRQPQKEARHLKKRRDAYDRTALEGHRCLCRPSGDPTSCCSAAPGARFRSLSNAGAEIVPLCGVTRCRQRSLCHSQQAC